MSRFQTWDDFACWLDRLGMFHMDFGLHRMESIIAELELQNPPFRMVQVLGTNGKGSTATFLAALGQAHGCKTGLYTSPHFVSPKERILVNGDFLPDHVWINAANAIMKTKTGPDLTYFEFLTVLALLAFQESEVNMAVFEAGMGGAHDATTALSAHAICFTPIALDHQNILGKGLESIARDKAEAIRSNAPVISAPQYNAANMVLQEAARSSGSSLEFARPLPKSVKIGMSGKNQNINAATALAAWKNLAEQLNIEIRQQAVEKAFAKAFIPGRFQFVPATGQRPALLLDGAHNPHGMQALANEIKMRKPAAIVFSTLGDKDWRDALAILSHILGPVPLFTPKLQNSRAADVAEVAAFRNMIFPSSSWSLTMPDALPKALDAAFATVNDGYVLVTGSLYLLGEFYALHPSLLRKNI